MAETTADLIIKIAQLLLILMVLFLLIYRRNNKKIKLLDWMIAVFSLSAAQGITEIFIYYLKYIYGIGLDNPRNFRFNEIHSIPYAFALFTIYILAELMTGYRPHPIRFSLIVSVLASYLSIYFYTIFDNYSLEFDHPAYKSISKTIFDFYQVIVMIFISYIFFKAYRKSNNKQNKIGSLLIFISTVLYVLGASWELGEDLLHFPPVYGAITFSFTFIILAIIYIKYPYFVFTVPTRIHKLILSTDSGLYLYSVELKTEQITENSDELLAAAINSIIRFFEQETGSQETIRLIDLGDREMIFSAGKYLQGIMIVDNSSYIVHKSLEHFITEFEKEFDKNTNTFNIQMPDIEEGKKIVLRCFPYIESEESLQTSFTKDSIDEL